MKTKKKMSPQMKKLMPFTAMGKANMGVPGIKGSKTKGTKKKGY